MDRQHKKLISEWLDEHYRKEMPKAKAYLKPIRAFLLREYKLAKLPDYAKRPLKQEVWNYIWRQETKKGKGRWKMTKGAP